MLNNQQKRAVKATKGRILILAGAGSGKTSVLTHRIAHLIQDLHVPPSAILGLTFTNKAAKEMKERVGELIDKKAAKEVTLCTFHSFCMQVLRKEIHNLGYTKEFSLYDERDVKRLVQQLARQLLEHEGELPSVDKTMSQISYAKSRGLGPKEPLARDLFNHLQTSMRAYNAVDFDSLLSLTVQLFQDHPTVLKTYQDRYQYVMIDEYQDTSPVQYQIASMLCKNHNNLCVVGDDDQSIYSWRGADVKHILEFEADETIKLEQNYRSTPMILHAANAVIRNNKERHNKELWSAQHQRDPITLFHAPTEQEEAQAVVAKMIWLRKHKNIPWNEMAILYRSNILSAPLEIALMQGTYELDGKWVKGIPYQVFGGTEFYERSEIKDLVAYLKVIANPLDQEALLRIINVPRRGISEAALDHLTQINRSRNIPLWALLKEVAPAFPGLSDRGISGIQHFVKIIEEAQEKFSREPLGETFKWLLDRINYKKAIDEEVKSDKQREFKWENAMRCGTALEDYEKTATSPSLTDFVSTMLLDVEQWRAREKDFSENRVNLMTFHGAKGLEFTACFLVGLEDHLIPHEKSLSEGSLEEERRLMYVAMTRAKTYLTMSMARARKRMGKESKSNPSRFIFEIPKELLNMTPWTTNAY